MIGEDEFQKVKALNCSPRYTWLVHVVSNEIIHLDIDLILDLDSKEFMRIASRSQLRSLTRRKCSCSSIES